jgi:uncharacterized protein YdhG (YjbR/CyaY superfamily)
VARSNLKTVSAYLAAQPPAARAVLKQVRAAMKKALPRAEEVISYGIPGYKLPGIHRPVIYFAGFKGHYAIYPVTRLPGALGKAIAPYKVSVGTARFDYAKKVPAALIARVAKFKAAEYVAAQAERDESQKKRSRK